MTTLVSIARSRPWAFAWYNAVSTRKKSQNFRNDLIYRGLVRYALRFRTLLIAYI
ncbi:MULTISPECIES: hypothetical protein [Planktothricoides]|nr:MULTISPECIES: hypothetical protein [Planktothricoides]MBD2547563.1 hypothetical protein [Planktothricoides raciborskii FACHB-1370]MBD2586040.1 hypothetical protein [Planktothricoides raciborskii FACHB-1261]